MKWRCVCGYVHDGEEAPERCPKCGAPKSKFTRIEDQSAELIDRSRLSNQLLMGLATLGESLAELGEAGIEDDLDPGCLQTFKLAKKAGIECMQAAKAEIQAHIGKGKWG
ncbi:MAG: rubredoxin-like domain-containing protein [Bacillota bacterium]